MSNQFDESKVARDENGQFGAKQLFGGDGWVDLGITGDERAALIQAEASKNQEDLALDYAIDAIGLQLEDAAENGYSDEDIERLEVQHQILSARARQLHDEQQTTPTTARGRMSKLAAQYRELTKEVHTTALVAISEYVRDEHPDAAFFALEESDQGAYMISASLYDANGNLVADEFDDDGAASWLDQGGDLPDYWSQHQVSGPDIKAAGGEMAENLKHWAGTYVFKVGAGEDIS